MHIREAAKRTGLSVHAIRYYESINVLPPVGRTAAGVRDFSEEDVRLLGFLVTLKRTGMSLSDIMVFLRDGCILEQLNQGDVPVDVIRRRSVILQQHRADLVEQRRQLDELLRAVDEKLAFYGRYVAAEADA